MSESKELGLIRLKEDGRIDTSFGREGIVHIRFPGARHGASAYLEELTVRGDQAAIDASYCGSCQPVVALIDLGIAEALTMASRTPATFLGLESELGSIAPGYRADLVAFNGEFEVIETWVAGQSCRGGQSM